MVAEVDQVGGVALVDIGRTDVAVLDSGPADWMPQAAGGGPETGR